MPDWTSPEAQDRQYIYKSFRTDADLHWNVFVRLDPIRQHSRKYYDNLHLS